MNVESVACSDQQLHLAEREPRMGLSCFTLCLKRWKRREPCREDSKLCPECVEKFGENNS